MSNNISLVGRLSKDPELKKVGDHELLELNIASDVGYGERKVTNWFKCQVWGKRATSLSNHLGKGKQVFITGEFCARPYEGKNGKGISNEIKVSELSFVGGGGSDNQGGSSSADDSQDLPF